MQKELKIRFSDKNDIPFILEFVKSLARHAHHLDEVVATEALLTENLFHHRYAEAIIAEIDLKPIGYALFFHTFSTFLGKPGIYLEDLFVEEEFRSRGYGKQILSFLAKVAIERGCGRLEWSVLDWDKRAIKFYRSMEASPKDETTVFRLAGSKLAALALNKGV